MMSVQLYNDIMKTIKAQVKVRECQSALEEKYPTVSPLTLGSILNNHVQKKMKVSYSKHTTQEKVAEYYDRFLKSVGSNEGPGIFLRLADENSISPVLMARVILEGYIRDCQAKEMQEYAKERRRSTNGDCDSTPGYLSPTQNQAVMRSEINRLLRDSSQIPDRDLAYEVYLCTVHDDQYGPMSDVIKQTIGQEYEQILKYKLTDLGVSYIDEGILRQEGYDKTPDFKLEIPIAIGDRVINWIESKALFGDEETHQTYLDDQLMSYWNRFGPGLVIYWFGYCETLESITIPSILISDHLPANIIQIDPDAGADSLTSDNPTCSSASPNVITSSPESNL